MQACQEICARSYREWRAEEEVCCLLRICNHSENIDCVQSGCRRHHGCCRVFQQGLSVKLLNGSGHDVDSVGRCDLGVCVFRILPASYIQSATTRLQPSATRFAVLADWRLLDLFGLAFTCSRHCPNRCMAVAELARYEFGTICSTIEFESDEAQYHVRFDETRAIETNSDCVS